MREVFFNTPYNFDRSARSAATALFCPPEEGMTQQQFADECDINVIVRRFGLTGEMPANPRVPLSGDFAGVTDYKSALDALIAADDAFMELPAHVRAEFANDPQKLMEFVADDKNRQKAVEMGLVAAPPEKTRDVVQAVDELAAKLAPVTASSPPPAKP